MSKLAIKGGKPIRKEGFLSWPRADQTDIQNLKKTLESGSWGADGCQNRKFQEDFAAFSGVKHCLTVANGTVSIELILRALGIGRGDEVIVPPYTFIASISALIYAGAKPVFADIEPDTYNLSPESAEKMITSRTKAIMPVYIGGRPANLKAFQELCDRYGLYLIGDAAQAVGSEYDGKGIGNYGIATSISLQNTKNLTCGEGGLILTNDDNLYEKLSRMLSGGYDPAGRLVSLGLASGMSEFQAAMLNTQLPRLAEQIEHRMASVAYLDKALADLEFVYTMKQDPHITKNSYHLYLIGIREDWLKGVSRQTFVEAVNAEGIPLSMGYVPAYDFPCIAGEYTEGCVGGPIQVKPETPMVEQAGRHDGCWLTHTMLLGEEKDLDDIVKALVKVYENLDELRQGRERS